MAATPDYIDQLIQRELEKTVREQYELHGWAMAVSIADPVDILIMMEEDEDEISIRAILLEY